MSDCLKQSQRAGDHSTNVQAQHVEVHHHGPPVAEVMQTCMALFQDNFLRLQSEARRVAEERAKEITERFLEELMQRNPAGIACAQDPDMQAAIFTVQREYARTGDKDVADVLLNLLADRAAQNARSLRQIVLNECLGVVPKLTRDQIDILSVCFLMRYTRRTGLQSLTHFNAYLAESIVPFSRALPRAGAIYQHLQYTGCAAIEQGSCLFAGWLYRVYSGFLCNGFSLDAFGNIWNPEGLLNRFLIPCFHNRELWQVAVPSLEEIPRLCKSYSVPEPQAEEIVALQRTSTMHQGEISEYLQQTLPALEPLIEAWNNSFLKSLTLTSVGIAIGHTNLRRTLKRDDYDLSVWIP